MATKRTHAANAPTHRSGKRTRVSLLSAIANPTAEKPRDGSDLADFIVDDAGQGIDEDEGEDEDYTPNSEDDVSSASSGDEAEEQIAELLSEDEAEEQIAELLSEDETDESESDYSVYSD